MGYSPRGLKESDTTERLIHTHTHTHSSGVDLEYLELLNKYIIVAE